MATIGIDCTAAYEQGAGIGRYVRDLIRALAAHDRSTAYRLFVAGAPRDGLPRARPEFPVAAHAHHAPLVCALGTGSNFLCRSRRSPEECALFHATDFTLPPTLPGTKTLLTVHDLSFVRAPETSTPVLKAYLDRVVPRSARRATHVLADSQATKDDLIELYGMPPEKITVLLSGVNPEFKPVTDTNSLRAVRQRYQIPDNPYILSIGTVQPRKNYARLITALAALGPAHEDVHLVIAGGRGWLDSPIFRAVYDQGLEDRVHFIGFARDEDLPALYSGAACLAYPSLYEGFGFPVLEAMACATPVVTSTISSMPEVAGTRRCWSIRTASKRLRRHSRPAAVR